MKPRSMQLGDACCGCGVCASVCPVACITIETDAVGFPYPQYNEFACIHCNKCDGVCPCLSENEEQEACSAFWAQAKEDAVLERSSSGGIFSLLAKECLHQGGTVYGAAFDDSQRHLSHIRVDNEGALDRILRSKYLQSDLPKEVYTCVSSDLAANKRVLFCGTPCQVKAMRNYIDQTVGSSQHLILVDIICHGVPSPKLWGEYLGFRSKANGDAVQEVNFRDKTTGWERYSLKLFFQGGSAEIAPFTEDWYMKAFLSNASLRSSCFACRAKRSSGSDITLGDYWGIDSVRSEVGASRGVSAVICNTEKGAEAYSEVEGWLIEGPSSMASIARDNLALLESVEPFSKRDEFMSMVASQSCSIEDLMGKWSFRKSVFAKVFSRLKRLFMRRK